MQNNDLLKCGQKLMNNSFQRNVFTLVMGTAFAQFFPVALSPVLTRLYSPEAFGVLAFYMSGTMVLATTATGRYEQAVILPEDDNDSLNIVLLSIIISTLFSVAIFVLLILANEQAQLWIKNENLNFYLRLLPVSVLLLATYLSLYYWFNRAQLYKEITFNKASLAIGIVVAQLSLYRFPQVGLVIGYVTGQCIGVGCSVLQMYLVLRRQENPIEVSRMQILKQAKLYIKFPKFLLVGHTMNAMSGHIPVVLLSSFYGTSFSGFYSLTFRVITSPMSLIGTAIGDVFRQSASRQYATTGQCRGLFVKTFKSLVLIATVPSIIFFVASPHLFPLIFGPEWSKAGTYAFLLTPMLFCQFITVPLCSMFMIAEKQELDLLWQMARITLSFGSIICGYILYKSDNVSILLFSLAFSGLYLVNGLMSYLFSCNSKRI